MNRASEPILQLHIRLLGPIELSVEGRAFPRLPSRKPLWLLALLTLRANRDVERDWLAATLWPDSVEARAFYNLRENLVHLRRALGTQASRLVSPAPRTLRLELAAEEADVVAFDQAIARQDTTSLEQAVALYGGPLLEGCLEEWVFPERHEREQSYLTALERLAAQAITSGDTDAAIGRLQRVVEVDTLRESAHRSLMEALAARGDYAAVSNVYRDLRLHLHAELHTEPAAETSALFTRLRQQGRDRSQTSAVRSATSTPPLPATPPNRRLPRSLTTLIGREQEITEIVARLGADCLVTLTGPGGVGKTRLALQVAHELADDYPDGVWFVELAGVNDPALIAQTLHSHLDLQDQSNRSALQSLLDYLRSRHALLVLDNCEHLVGACADLVQAVLSACAHMRVLATSRQSLGLSGEVVWRVPPLEVPDEGRLDWMEKDAASLLEYAGVQLFVERARQADPQFRVSGHNALAVAQVCARLEGLPLATELAAARVGVMTPAEMLSQWDRRWKFLVSRKRDAAPRHQSLQAAIAWSYDLLSEDLQRFFVRLSVFRGGWTAEAAEQVCCADKGVGSRGWRVGKANADLASFDSTNAVGHKKLLPTPHSLLPSSVFDALTSLHECSLILAEQREGVTRFRMLETLREFGRELLTEGERVALCRRHRDCYLHLAEEAELEKRTADLPIWLQRLDAEHDNLQAVLDWCAETPDEGQAGMHLVGALSFYWVCRNEVSEGRRRLEEFRTRSDAQEATAGRGRALLGGVQMAFRQDDFAEMRSLQVEGASVWERLGDAAGIALARYLDGQVAYYENDLPLTRARFEEYLGWCREHGTALEISRASMLVAAGPVNVEEARALYAESLDMARRAGQTFQLMRVLSNWGVTELEHENYDRAEPLLMECLRLSRELNDKHFLAGALGHLGDIVGHRGERRRQRALLEEAVVLLREIGRRTLLARVCIQLGHLCLDEGEYATARRYYEEGVAVQRELRDPVPTGVPWGVLYGVEWCRLDVGMAAMGQGDLPAARCAVGEALQRFQAGEDRAGLLACLESFAALAAAQGRSEQAARLFGASEGLRESLNLWGPEWWKPHWQRLLASVEALRTNSATVAWREGRTMTLEQAVAHAVET